MTPAARIAAAIEILDRVVGDEPAEQCLIQWARRSRYAGSGDRAAVRDLVFDALRKCRSMGWLGGGESGRHLMIGRCRMLGEDPERYFSGEGYAPAPLFDDEKSVPIPLSDAPDAVQLDCQEWAWSRLKDDLGADAEPTLRVIRERAPVFLRVNARKATVEEVVSMLSETGVEAKQGPLSPTALMVKGHPRKIETSEVFREGLVELQDAASQAVVDLVADRVRAGRVLDYCAGGGGKSVHLAVSEDFDVTAHDANPERMRDIPVRAARAGVDIHLTEKPEGLFDCVVADVPCSGSGAWRRQPEAKWRLDAEKLRVLTSVQDEILGRAACHVREGGTLAYVTCSLFRCENDERADAFLEANKGWTEVLRKRFLPKDGGDGFFVALFERA